MSTISENPGLRQLVVVFGAIVLALLVRLFFVEGDQRVHAEDRDRCRRPNCGRAAEPGS